MKMKKVSIYSLLFALLACNPLHIGAESAFSRILEDPSLAFCACALGILSLHGFASSFNNVKDMKNYRTSAATLPAEESVKKQQHLDDAANAKDYAIIFGISTLTSALAAGYLLYEAVRQAKF